MKSVGRYDILEQLGQGGMGTVYKAFDPLLTRVVAVKVISSQLGASEDLRERFFREARAAAQLSHRNIITIHDLGEQDGLPFLAMEYLEGRDLDKVLDDPEPLPLPRRLELALGIAEGLAHAHANGLVHRDIKPANVFVTHEGVVKILDFGLARLATSDMTRSNVLMGTVKYMAPEQLRGERSDHRADIFSFGVLLYELLGGRPPFQGDSAASTMYLILNAAPEALDELDPELGPPLTTIVDRAIAKRREDRYQHMTDLLRDLEAAHGVVRGVDPRALGRTQTILAPGAARRPDSSARDVLAALDGSAETVAITRVASPQAGEPSGLRPDSRPPAPPSSPAVAPSGTKPARWRTAVLAAAGLAVVALGGWLLTRDGGAPAGPGAPVRAERPETEGPAPPAPAGEEPSAVPPANTVAEQAQAPARAQVPPAPPVAPAPSARERERERQVRAAEEARAAALAAERTRAETALGAVNAAKRAAVAANARDLAGRLFASAEREETSARAEFDQGRFASAAGRLEATATLYSAAAAAAAAEAQSREARARAAEDLRRRAAETAPPRTAPPPPAPEPPAPPPGPSDRDLVSATLRRYTAALEARDLAALRSVWPTLGRAQQEAIESEFANARSISVSLANPRIDINGASATVTAVRRYQLHTRDGQQLRSDTTTTLRLRRAGDAWVIESVSHAPL